MGTTVKVCVLGWRTDHHLGTLFCGTVTGGGSHCPTVSCGFVFLQNLLCFALGMEVTEDTHLYTCDLHDPHDPCGVGDLFS